MTGILKAAAAALAVGMASLPATAQELELPNMILILDASGSIWGQIDGVNKIVIACDMVSEILGDFPEDQNLGFIA